MNVNQTPDELADFPIVISLPIQWGDQDAFGHVNNTIFIRWLESARIAYFEQTGLLKSLANDNLGPILASLTCHYRQQLRYPDTVHIGARIASIGNSSVKMEHAVYCDSKPELVADGDTVVVIFDYKANQSKRVPDSARAIIQVIEGDSLSA